MALFIDELASVVQSQPGRCAILSQEGERVVQLSYAELWQRSGDIAGSMTGRGLIGICLPRSADFIATLLGVWRRGAEALIMDPDWPEERRSLIVEECQPLRIITPESLAELRPFNGEVQHRSDEQDAAYVIYTSGSSGRPKGVRVAHRGLVPMLRAQIAAFELHADSRAFWMLGVGFDASLSDIGTALLSGATLCFTEPRPQTVEELVAALEHWQVTHLDLPPAWLPHLPVGRSESLHVIILGGEVAAVEAVRGWSQRVKLINVYGPTEATVCTSLGQCGADWRRPLIGQPLPGVEYRIRQVGSNVNVGELIISGDQVALGYPWAQDLHEQRFSAHGRSYSTGDLVRLCDDGEWEFLGRVDRQIKLRGRLLCPEEVEACLLRHAAVERCWVTLVVRNGRPMLVGVVQSSVPAQALLPDLQRYCSEALPSWMIPRSWSVWRDFPEMSQGKVAEQAVLARLMREKSFCISDEELTDAELQLREIVATSLGMDPHSIRLDDDFYDDLGGDSLAMIGLLAAFAKQGWHVPADLVQREKTLRRMVESLGAGADEGRDVGELQNLLKPLLLKMPAFDGGEAKDVFMTGATGFFGGALLGEWLMRHKGRVTCLVRGGRERVASALRAHGYGALANSERWDAVEGDLSLERFGWDAAAHDERAARYSGVLHVAADVRLFATLEELMPTQVLGTRRVLEFVKQGRHKALHFVSTLSVFVDAEPWVPVCLETDDRRGVGRVHGGYAQSKWMAEQQALAAKEQGWPVWIYRLGLLTANQKTHHAPKSDWARMMLRGLLDPTRNAEAAVDVTPVDYAAAVVAALAAGAAGTYHVASPEPVTCARLMAVGLRPMTNDAGALSRSHRTLDVFKTTGTRFDMIQTAAALAAEGLAFPEVSDDYLRCCFDSSSK
jgi:amino acid adenylation domain-containing protein/thioester reductase-like protein